MSSSAAALPRRSLHTAEPGERSRRLVDRAASILIAACTVVGTVCLLSIISYVVIRGAPALNLAFFTQRPLPFGEVGGGVLPAIAGTITLLLMASLVALPLGLGTAIYLSEFGRGPFATLVRFALDLLAGMPSIVVGVFVWALVVRHLIGQYSGIAGALALALIMLPIVTRTVEEILRLVPDDLREASFALGAPRWRTILGIVLPTARAGVVTGVMLSLARAGGETAPLLLTALGNQFLSFDVRGPVASLPVQIYQYAVAPYEDWHTKAWGAALVLIVVIGILRGAMTWQSTRSSSL